MTKPWNQAAWKQNTYRSSGRKYGPVGDYLAVNAHQSELDERCCRGCGHHVCSCAPDGWRVAETSVQEMGFGLGVTVSGIAGLANQCQTFRQLCDIDPSDEEVAELSKPQVLTLADVAKLPVGTRVVVETGAGVLRTGAEFTLQEALGDGVSLRDDSCWSWALSFKHDARITFRIAEDKPALLTLPEAAEACRAGKVVRCLEDDCQFAYQFTMNRFVTWSGTDWVATGFPERGHGQLMGFEVVE